MNFFSKNNEILACKAQLAELQCRLLSIHQNLATIRFKPDGTIIDASPLFLKALGYTLDDVRHLKTQGLVQ